MKEVLLTLLWIIFIADSVLLVLIVLLQSGRGGGLSGMLGGGGTTESALGPKSGLPRITGVMAAIFFGAAIFISILTRPRHVLNPREHTEESSAEETPGAPETKAVPGPEKGEPKGAAPKAATEPKATTATQPAPKAGTGTTPPAPPKATTAATPAPKAAPATSTTPRTTP